MWDRENMAALVAELVAAQVREFAGGYYQRSQQHKKHIMINYG